MAATGQTSVSSTYTNALTTGTAGLLTDSFTDNVSYQFGSGTAANQIDLPWSVKATLSTSTTNYTASALAGPGSGTTAFARVREIQIHNLMTTEVGTNTVVFAPGATHPWLAPFASGGSSTTAGITIPPGGVLVLVAPLTTGFPVVASSSDQFSITTVGAVNYSVILLGASV